MPRITANPVGYITLQVDGSAQGCWDPSIPTGDVLRTAPRPPATSAAPGYDVVAGPTAETCTWGMSEPKGLTRQITVSSDTRAWVRCPDTPTP